MRVREANPADIPAIIQIERQNATAAHWSQEQYQALFSADGETKTLARIAWVVENAASNATGTPIEHPEIVAFLIAHHISGDWELENIVVARRLQRRGIGRLLLNEFVSYARSGGGNSIFLEVRESNDTARALYRRAGFEETGLRKSYYLNPIENATLFRLNILTSFS